MIPGVNVEGWIFEAVRRHETEQSPALIVGSGLIRESDAQIAIVAEQSGRVTYDGAGWEPEARIGNRGDWGERVGRPKRAEREKPESEEAREGSRSVESVYAPGYAFRSFLEPRRSTSSPERIAEAYSLEP